MSALRDIPRDCAIDMPNLLNKKIIEGAKINMFPLHEYWLDIGQIGDYKRANGEYKEIFE